MMYFDLNLGFSRLRLESQTPILHSDFARSLPLALRSRGPSHSNDPADNAKFGVAISVK